VILTEVWVAGHARTKGSLLNNQDTLYSKRWRALMASVVRKDVARRMSFNLDMTGQTPVYPHKGAVAVEIDVWLPVADVIKVGAGDVDKLARNVLDAIAADAKNAIMNGGVILNDNQVVRLRIDKWEAPPGAPMGQPAGLLLQVLTAEYRVLRDAAEHAAAVVRGW
jgi:hypothetical protein